jgi:hypothetical protein
MISKKTSTNDDRESLPLTKPDHESTSFEDVYEYLKRRNYISKATKNDKRAIRRKAANFTLEEEKLYYHRGSKDKPRLVVRKREEQLRRVEACHVEIDDTKQSQSNKGHCGRNRTLQKLTTGFYWKGMKADVENWVGT